MNFASKICTILSLCMESNPSEKAKNKIFCTYTFDDSMNWLNL